LEVSSAGINRPLRTPEQFRRVLGRRVKARFRHPIGEHRGVVARLTAVEETSIRLECDDGSSIEAAFDEVERANLEYEFETPQKPSSGGKRSKRRRK
jgi:ribosome maturation factor RimP